MQHYPKETDDNIILYKVKNMMPYFQLPFETEPPQQLLSNVFPFLPINMLTPSMYKLQQSRKYIFKLNKF